MGELQLNDLLKHTKADGAIVLDTNGEVIDSLLVSSEKNVAAMLSVLIRMCKDLSVDMEIGTFKQIVIKAVDGVFIVDKMHEDDVIVGVYSKDVSKGGLIKLSMDKLNR